MKRKLIYVGFIALGVIIGLGIGWLCILSIFNEDNRELFSPQSLNWQPELVEEDDNLFVQWETDQPISDDTWIEVGYDGFVYAGSKVINDEDSSVYYNQEKNNKYQHRVLASWSMEEDMNEIQFQISSEKGTIASKVFILDFEEKVIR